jgi:hypothetical protein
MKSAHGALSSGCPKQMMRLVLLTFLCGLFLVSFLSTSYPSEEENVCYPSEYACPVTPNLFPKREGSANTLRFTFPENAQEFTAGDFPEVTKRAARRISIALLNPERKNVEVRFTWTGIVETKPHYLDWGVYSGTFIVKADGNPNCFFLWYAGLPGNIPCRAFQLTIPPGVKVKRIAFSSLATEYASKYCPMPELEKKLNKAYQECRQNPEDKKRTALFLNLLEMAFPRYDCIHKLGGTPVPAWYLADYNKSVYNWTDILYRELKEENSLALRVFAEFLPTTNGFVAESAYPYMWKTVLNHPMFILENWESIREFKRNILGGVGLAIDGSDVELIRIYQQISEREPKYKKACEEIIETTKELVKDIRRQD